MHVFNNQLSGLRTFYPYKIASHRIVAQLVKYYNSERIIRLFKLFQKMIGKVSQLKALAHGAFLISLTQFF